jgi:hypothetical protein
MIVFFLLLLFSPDSNVKPAVLKNKISCCKKATAVSSFYNLEIYFEKRGLAVNGRFFALDYLNKFLSNTILKASA